MVTFEIDREKQTSEVSEFPVEVFYDETDELEDRILFPDELLEGRANADFTPHDLSNPIARLMSQGPDMRRFAYDETDSEGDSDGSEEDLVSDDFGSDESFLDGDDEEGRDSGYDTDEELAERERETRIDGTLRHMMRNIDIAKKHHTSEPDLSRAAMMEESMQFMERTKAKGERRFMRLAFFIG